MVKFSAVLLLVCFSAALVSTKAAELPFTKFCNEQQTTCTDTCGDQIKEFICNAVTGITTTPCTCVDGATKPAVDPPAAPAEPSTEEMDAGASSSPAPAGEPTSTTPATDAAATDAPAASSAARTTGSVVALGFVAAAMLF